MIFFNNLKRKYPVAKNNKSRRYRSYYDLATRLLIGHGTRGQRSFMLTSPGPGEGKTYTAVQLGVHLAMRGNRVLVVDADPWDSTLSKRFLPADEPGLLNMLADGRPLTGRAPLAGLDNFQVTGIGTGDEDVIKLLRDRLGTSLTDGCDFVFFDCPDLGNHYEPRLIAPLMTGSILVVRAAGTSVSGVRAAEKIITEAGGAVLGIVFNRYRNPVPKFLRHLF